MRILIWFLSLFFMLTALLGLFVNGDINRVIAMMIVAVYIKMWDSVKWNEPMSKQ